MNTQIASLVEETVRELLCAKATFTALDISNTLKAACYPVRHSDVAAIVRDVYGSGAMNAYNYRRTLIDVTTKGGQTQAFLYLPQPAREREYQARAQDALPPVPAELARDLADCTPAGATYALPRPPCFIPRSRRGRTRRDGALSIPLSVIRQMGWTFEATLSIHAKQGRLAISAGSGDIILRIWKGERLRVCRRTLQLSGLCLGNVTWKVQGDALHIIGS